MTKGRKANQIVRILIVKDYLLSNTNKSHYVTSSDIINHLESFGIHADRKTIFADIDRLEYDYGMKIERVRKKGYRALEPPFEANELRLMVDSVQSAKFITQKEAQTITKKIQSLADVFTRPSLNRTSYVGERIRNMKESVVSNTDRIYEAIALNNQISFKYIHATPSNGKRYSKNGEPYIVSPFALYWDNGNYYLYAYLSDKEEFRYYRIDRMESILLPLQLKREGVDLFKPKAFTNKRNYKIFRMFSGTEYVVKMQFINNFADAVIDEFGNDVMLIPCADQKHFEVNLPVQVSPPFYSWVAMFGRGAQILSPQEVVDEMKAFSEKVYSMYHWR